MGLKESWREREVIMSPTGAVGESHKNSHTHTHTHTHTHLQEESEMVVDERQRACHAVRSLHGVLDDLLLLRVHRNDIPQLSIVDRRNLCG